MVPRLALVVALVLAILLPAAAAAGSPPVDPTKPSTQVGVVVDSITPRVVKKDSTVTVTGSLRNYTDRTFTNLIMRLQSAAPVTSRAVLHGLETTPPVDYPTVCDFTGVDGPLAGHASKRFTVSCTAAALGLSRRGVYPLLVNLNANFEGVPARVGELNTYLPYFPKTPDAPTRVSWLWPIVDSPHRNELGVFWDDSLATRFAAGGQLYRRVHTALSLPGSMPLTLAIDPELVEAAMAMRDGYQVGTTDDNQPGTGGEVATQWLADLAELVHRPNVDVIALPYADPDIVALYRADLGDLVGRAYTRGAAVLARPPLNIANPEDIAWPAAGALNEIALDGLAAQRIDTVILDSQSVGDDGTPVAELRGSSAPSTVALLADHTLSELTQPTDYSDGTAANVQRFLAELAVITAGHPNQAQSVLIAPPRRWQQPPAYSRAILEATNSVPWASTTSISSLTTEDPTDHGPLQYPTSAGAGELRPTLTGGIRDEVDHLKGFASILAPEGDKDQLLTPYYDALLRASSTAWRGGVVDGGVFLNDARTEITALRGKVFIVVPSNGTYSLASSDSPLPVTVRNDLDVPIKVQIIASAKSAGFRADPFITTVIGPHKQDQSEIPTRVEKSGRFEVVLHLRTLDGEELGTPVDIQVRSTAYGTVALGITAGALAVLLILVARRFVLRVRAARSKPAEADDTETEPATDGEFAAAETPAAPDRGDP